MPRDGGFLREVAASDKTWSQQAGDLYLPVLGAGSHCANTFGVRTLMSKTLAAEGKDNKRTST